jgi:hypothetical protein
MKNYIYALLASGLLLTGCASTAPTTDKLVGVKTITFGDSAPKDEDFILYFPAGKPIPTRVVIDGNLLEQPAKDELIVQLKKDIYAYKQWISYDGKHWQHGRDVMRVGFKLKVPGPKHPEAGLIRVRVSEKSPQAKITQ